ncbi:hypothetical protein PgNI_10203, partial [Pyricularia grisea]|uniref:Uncharacterized protein n=1 Tax=Pyricularia grisea TaxID=148305 RepID=A0A6P8AXI1_PYRGI
SLPSCTTNHGNNRSSKTQARICTVDTYIFQFPIGWQLRALWVSPIPARPVVPACRFPSRRASHRPHYSSDISRCFATH